MEIGLPELLIILVIVIVLFGPGRFGKILAELGTGIHAFKEGLDPKGGKQQTTIKPWLPPAAPPEVLTNSRPQDGN